jgi:hypothetical protein
MDFPFLSLVFEVVKDGELPFKCIWQAFSHHSSPYSFMYATHNSKKDRIIDTTLCNSTRFPSVSIASLSSPRAFDVLLETPHASLAVGTLSI